MEGYAIEDHVPVSDVHRLLHEKPKAAGLRPLGSPGMDGPEYEGRKQPYDVLLIHKNCKAEVFQSYR